MTRLPTLFISHGSPMLAVEPGTTGPLLRRIGQQLPKPKAILVISAHWLTHQPTLTSGSHPVTIVITSYSIHYTKLYDGDIQPGHLRKWPNENWWVADLGKTHP